MFCKKSVLRNFAKFTGKHLCQSLSFNKVAGLNFIKRQTLAQVFSREFCEISKNTIFYRTPLVAASIYELLSVWLDIVFQRVHQNITIIIISKHLLESNFSDN